MTAAGVAPAPRPAPAGAVLHIPEPPNVRKANTPLPYVQVATPLRRDARYKLHVRRARQLPCL